MGCFRSLFTILLLCTAGSSWAQDAQTPDADRWYQVEVILFAHTEAHASEELWRQDIALAYPPNWVVLKSIEESLAAQQALDEQTLNATHTNDTQPAVMPNDATRLTALDLSQQAFYLLDSDARDMNDIRRSLHWNPKYRILYHQAWRQPIYDNDRAQSILISAGEKFGDYSELEGSFKLRVSRYLHLETNLWMTQFKHNFGQEVGDWPPLPTRPDRHEYINSVTTDNLEDTQLSPWDKFTPANDEFEYILNEPFIPERISLLKQSRRMRSNEMHLIDHPVVSMIIKLVPYEQPKDTVTTDIDIPVLEIKHTEQNP